MLQWVRKLKSLCVLGVQKHILGVAGWTTLLTYVSKKREDYLAEKDAVLRHYIQLHPEDFPTPGLVILIIIKFTKQIELGYNTQRQWKCTHLFWWNSIFFKSRE